MRDGWRLLQSGHFVNWRWSALRMELFIPVDAPGVKPALKSQFLAAAVTPAYAKV